MIPSGTAQYRHVNPDQGLSEVAALGQRDSIGGDVDQRTGQLWFAENARDWMAIIILSDKLNHLTRYGAMAVEGSPGAGRAKAEQAGTAATPLMVSPPRAASRATETCQTWLPNPISISGSNWSSSAKARARTK